MKKRLSAILAAGVAALMSFQAVSVPQMARKQYGGRIAQAMEQRVSGLKERPKGFHMQESRAVYDRCDIRRPHRFAGEVPAGGARRVAANAASDLPQLVGSVIYNDTWTVEEDFSGLYNIMDGHTSLMFRYNSLKANGGGVEIDGIYYVTHYYEFWEMLFVDVAAYSVADGSEVNIFYGENDNIAADLTVDPTTGAVYGITFTSDLSGYQLARMEYTTSSVKTLPVAPLEGNWNALACDAHGQLYGISYEGSGEGTAFRVTSSRLCKIDKQTGEVTTVGVTGQLPQFQSSATIDAETGRMFWNVCPPDGSGILCEVDLQTGEATELCAFRDNDEITGMYVSSVTADSKAPAAVTDLAVDFQGASLTGSVSFTAPTTTFDGQETSGDLIYDITANGDAVATGRTAFGASVEREVTVSSPGDYMIAVTVRNQAGKSPVAKVGTFIGSGVPVAPSVSLAYMNGEMHLSWTPSDATVGGGYINPAGVTYAVTRFPGNVKVAEGIMQTSFSEPVDEPKGMTDYYYVVVAHNGEVSSVEAKSNVVTLGSILPPYSNTFDLPSSLAGYSVIDANGDEKVWTYDDHSVRMVYNTAKDMDDWLITPSVYLEEGKTYYVSFNAWAYTPSSPERVEARWGASATVDAMENELVPPTVVAVRISNPLELGGYMTPTVSGKYYVGIHGISDADRFYLNIDNLSISEGVAASVPAEPTALTVVADPDGGYLAEISFKAPELDIAGNRLTSLERVEVRCGDALVKTFNDPAPGETLSFTDQLQKSGTVTYSVCAFNASGAGRSAQASVYIGIDRPSDPKNIEVEETGNLGEVMVSWDAIDTDWRGNHINPSMVTYYVAFNNGLVWEPVTERGPETSRRFRAVPVGEQDFVQYAVFAETAGGASVALSPTVCVGVPYNGIEESFADGSVRYAWSDGFTEGSAEWSISDNSSYQEIVSHDADNGFATMEGYEAGATSALISGKISLSGFESPMLRLYAYNVADGSDGPDLNELDIYIREYTSEEWTLLSHSVMHELGDGAHGWQQCLSDLSAYTGKTVQLRFQGVARNYVCTMIDNIKVGNIPQDDVAVGAIDAPAMVPCGSGYTVRVEVTNSGMRECRDVYVDLYASGVLLETKQIPSIANGKTISVAFDCEMSVLAASPVSHHAVVRMDGDDNDGNNVTEVCEVVPVVSRLPAVTGLNGRYSQDGVELSWSAPDMDNVPAEASLVDFEDALPFAKEYAGWTFVDVDGVPVGGFQGLDIPGVTIGDTKASFIVFDTSGEPFANNATFTANSGEKYLAALFRSDDGPCDDWAISPMLDGFEQEISFFAKSYNTLYPEKMEMYYSTGSLSVEDFIRVGAAVSEVPGEWTEFSFTVPQGARYFAIRSCATGGFMLMLDDFRFAPADASARLSLVGYDVYRDGVRINSEPVASTEYLDRGVSDGKHAYQVVAVYTTGLSAPSDELVLDNSGIDGLQAGSVMIIPADGMIMVRGADGMKVEIAATDGKLVYCAMATDELRVPVSPGVYVAKVGDKTVKVFVR